MAFIFISLSWLFFFFCFCFCFYLIRSPMVLLLECPADDDKRLSGGGQKTPLDGIAAPR